MIVDYMSLPKDQLEPIMTNTENIVHYFPMRTSNRQQP
jgi:hypothetical protein